MSEEYKPNSNRFKEAQRAQSTEKKKVEKVVRGKVKTKPRSGVSKLADAFISDDASNVKTTLVEDILVPAAKKTISDLIVTGLDIIMYGESRGRRSGSSSSYVSYRDYSRRDDDRRRDSSRRGYSHEDIILESRAEAEEVLTRMDELIETYGTVSIADMYDLIGKSCAYTDNNYGWTNIRNAEPIRVRDGYMLKLPKALPLK